MATKMICAHCGLDKDIAGYELTRYHCGRVPCVREEVEAISEHGFDGRPAVVMAEKVAAKEKKDREKAAEKAKVEK